jgi:D-alanyl-D-alanine carboxypeptidase/D-alanyl-D-alanine-endopeptidase (penicillin-binding protein 4)
MLCSPCTQCHPQAWRGLRRRPFYSGLSQASSSVSRMEGFWKRMACRFLGCIGHRRSSLLVVVLSVILIFYLHAAAWSAISSSPSLNSYVNKLLSDPCFQKGQYGARAVNLASRQTLFDVNGDALLIPASTTKLITSAAALLRLSPHYRFRTMLLSNAPLQNGVLEGDLYLKGYGDPALVIEKAWLLARGLRQHGVHRIQGDLIGDDSFFDMESRGRGWADDRSQRAFNAKIGALSVNFNSATIVATPGLQPGDPVQVVVEPVSDYLTIQNTTRTSRPGQGQGLSVTRLPQGAGDMLVIEGSLAVGSPVHTVHRNLSNPTLHATMVIREQLQREAVHIAGRPRTGLAPSAARALYVHHSRALYRIIDDLNKFSNNFIAEQVLKTLGAEVYGPPGSWGKGLTVVADVLESFGIASGTYTLVDGSGLSRLNRLSAAQLVTVLTRMAQDFRIQPEYMASLRTPDADGRNSRRFHGADFAQRARVKTGSLDDVSALAGYISGKHGELIAFAVLLNGPLCSMERAWEVQDAVAQALMRGEG